MEKFIIPADPHYKKVFAIVNTPDKTLSAQDGMRYQEEPPESRSK